MPKLTEEQRAALIQDYLSGMTAAQVAEKYGIKPCSAWEFLKRRNLVRSQSEVNRRHVLDQSAFNWPLSDEAKYWVGYLMADGCIHERKDCATTICLNIAAQDVSHLKRLALFLKTDQPVVVKEMKQYEGSFNSGPQAKFGVRSYELANDLINYGVTPKKSFTAKALKGLENSSDFWRGYIDGNGTIRIHTHTTTKHETPHLIVSSASKELLEQFLCFVKSHQLKCKANANFYGDKKCGTVCIGGRFAIALLKIIYSKNPSLARKRKKAEIILAKHRANPEWCHRNLKP